MAARLDPHHDEKTRQKIKTTQLLHRLQANALGDINPELSVGQIRSIEGCLDRSLPKMSQLSIDATVDHALTINLNSQVDGNKLTDH
jgi:hypothetical protein